MINAIIVASFGLGAVWKAIPKDEKELYIANKDKRKAELTEGQS